VSQRIESQIITIALVVFSYDKAIEFYTQKLSFVLIEEPDFGDDIR